jgi:hypothetical protein
MKEVELMESLSREKLHYLQNLDLQPWAWSHVIVVVVGMLLDIL